MHHHRAMKQIARFASLFAVILSTAAIAHGDPVQVTYDGTIYDVTAENISFSGSASLLESQVWYGDQSVAEFFATSVGTQLGLQSYAPPPSQLAYQWGPLFAYDAGPDAWALDGGDYQPTYFPNDGGVIFTYAVATAENVPDGGTTLVMLGIAVAGFLCFRRKLFSGE